jgi:hypothetical protein
LILGARKGDVLPECPDFRFDTLHSALCEQPYELPFVEHAFAVVLGPGLECGMKNPGLDFGKRPHRALRSQKLAYWVFVAAIFVGGVLDTVRLVQAECAVFL